MNLLRISLAVVLLSGCGENSAATDKNEVIESSLSSEQLTEGDAKCLQVVKAYVQSKKGWKDEEYKIVQEQMSDDSRGFSVRHVDDETPLPEGGLKSFHVNLDKSCEAVTEELAYQ